MLKPFRLGIIFTHPTQHHSLLWRRLAEEPDIDITVMYLSAQNTIKGQGDRDLGTTEPWDVDLTSGYKNEFLKTVKGEVSPIVKKGLLHTQLINRLTKSNFDAVYVSSFVTYSHRLAFLLCKLRGIPVISQNDGTVMTETGFYRLPYKVLLSAIYPFLFQLSDYWLPIGNHNEIYLRHYGVPSEKMFPAPVPFDRKRFEETLSLQYEEVQQIRAKYSLDPDTVLYGFAGKYVERKQPFDFIEAIRKAHQKNPNIRGLLIGGGKLAEEINRQIDKLNGEVVNIGFVNQSKLPLFYAAMDVFVCPSSIDSHPLVVSESMAAGCPVILSDRCGNWGYSDILQHRYNGLVYPCGDIDKLAEAILTLSEKSTREQYAQRAKEVVATQDLEQTVRAMKKVIERIRNGNKSA